MNCRNPTELVDESTTVIGYREPAMRGASVTFACISGLMLSGPNTSTCMGNGEWEPDLRKMVCTGTSMQTTTDKTFKTLNRDGMIAVASSVTVFVVASILFFIVGFLCGHFCWKERKKVDQEVDKNQFPYYEDVVLKRHVQELELKGNVAYGPVRSCT